MASASAGTLQSGSAIITGMVPSSSTSTSATIVDAQLTTNNFQHQQKIQQTQHLQVVQQQQPLQHQPQQQQNHFNNNLQFHHSSQNITAIQNRHSFVPRVGAANISHLNNGNPGNRSLTTNNVVLNNDSNDTIITQSRSTEMISHQQIQQQQQNHNNNNNIMQEQQLSVQQQQQQQQQSQQHRQVHRIINAANLAPGWRRLISNNEVIYVSPSGASLRNHGQIKDYLLSPGTCKCGLPCPLRPEYFFNFNSQVPNMLLQIPLENGLPSRSSLLCMHQRRFLENQQNIKDAKKRKFGDISMSGKLSTSTPAAQCNSVAIYSGGNVMQTSQVMASNNRIQMMSSQLVTHTGQQQQQQQQQPQQPQQQLISNITFPVHNQQKINQSQQQQQQQIESLSVKVDEKQIGNVTISKTPPWRKNSILQQQQGNQNISQVQQTNQITVSTATSGPSVFSTTSTNERVPPLPQSHLCQQQSNSQVSAQNVAPPWQDHHVQTRFVKARATTSGTTTIKKKPNFRDDPTGYLDHQTAILHNSILNVVQSPDLNDIVQEDGFIVSGNQTIKTEQQQQQTNTNEDIPTRVMGSNLKSLKSEQGLTVMQQSQTIATVYHHPSSLINESKNENVKIDKTNYAPTTSKYYTSTQTGVYQTEQEKPQMKSENINPVSNFGQNTRIITSNRVVSDANLKNENQEISGNHPQQQQMVTNVPSSQISIEESSMQYQATDEQQQQQSICRSDSIITQPTTTSIGGQTVTHFPNGMVQVEHNCDNIVVSLKPQQQIQLQQQIQQHNILFRQNQQIQKSMSKTQLSNYQQQHENQSVNQKTQVPASQGSPIPSSTTYNRSTPDSRSTPEMKGPPQVGAISTSHESPHPCTSPIESPESPQLTIKTSISLHNVVHNNSNKNQQQNVFATSQTTSRNTITSVTAGKTITATTSANANVSDKSNTVNIIEPNNEIIHQSQKLSPGSIIPVSGLQLQPVVREPGNQLIMTSTGQIIVMPSQPNKSTNQVIINSPGGNNLVVNNQQSVLINQPNATATVVNNSQLIGNSVEVLSSQSNPSAATNLIQNPGSSLVIQNSGIVQTGQNIIQPSNNLIATSNNPNFIVNSSNNMQPMILNNSNILQQNGQNFAAGSNLMATAGGTKVISNQNIITNQSNVISNPQVLGNSNNIITNSGGIIGQQTVVLNALPNGGYVIQPNFATVDGQMVSQIVNQESSQTTTFIQQQPQQQRQIILTSPDSKRKAKKRKGSTGSSPPTPSSLSPQQSPTLQATTSTVASQSTSQTQQQGTVVQIASQYPTQGFQISPGLQGIVVNKNAQANAPQQQIIFQNGQIIQPVNLIGQQLLVPAGLVMTPETTTLLQIQNVGPCGSIITPQGMVLRAPSPQNKSFLSPNGSGQQFIVSGNNQVSPLGQIYGAPVGLVVPQSNSGTTTFVQQNTTIVQQQSQQQQQQQSTVIVSNSDSTVESHSNHGQGAISPPDTTTHSPRSPDRPPSERSGGSDMVQCVSSSEPDCVVSPILADSAQSPSTTDYDRGCNISYQNSNTIYKSETKIRRVETPPQFATSLTPDITSQMRPDSHESPTNSPIASATSTTTSKTTKSSKNGHNNNNSHNSIISGGHGATVGGGTGTNLNQTQITSSFCIGELVWGAARGHPAWPGKIVNPPDGVCTPSDSTWVQWFGCRPNVELVTINSLKSLSEGLEAHHKAQKDTRKSRKLNSQLERAIQEAMTELDRISTMPQQPSTTTPITTTKSRNRGRQSSNHLIHHQRSKPVRIAPAPPSTNTIQQQIRQQTNVSQMTNHHHQQSSSMVQQQQHQTQQRTPSSTTQQIK